jgi:hypothetical protein
MVSPIIVTTSPAFISFAIVLVPFCLLRGDYTKLSNRIHSLYRSIKHKHITKRYTAMPTIYRYIEHGCSPRHCWAVANASD